MNLTVGTLAPASLLIVGFLIPLFVQTPTQQQQRSTTQTTNSSAASAQGEIQELRVAVFIAPPAVMEQNGSLTGFVINLGMRLPRG